MYDYHINLNKEWFLKLNLIQLLNILKILIYKKIVLTLL